MTTAAFEARIHQDKDLQIKTLTSEGQQYVSKITGSWLCTFSVQIQNEKIHTIKDVICVD